MITGANGQIGVQLVKAISKIAGADNIVATDISEKKPDTNVRYETLNISDYTKFEKIVKENKIDYIVHLAAIISALGERKPDLAIEANVYGAINALNIARDHKCQIFVPSTIATYGGDKFQKENTPVDSIF